MTHKILRSFIIAIPLAFLFLVGGLAPLASAHPFLATEKSAHAVFDPHDPCETGSMPNEIQITSGTSNNPLGLPLSMTKILVDPCTLSYLVQKGNQAKVTVQTDGSVPGVLAPLFKQVVLAHVDDLWKKDLACPHPERGVFFTVLTPNVWTFLFTPSPSIDAFQALFPDIRCGWG